MAREEAAEALRRAADIQMPSRFEPYQTGDKVWLEGRNLTTTHPSTKLAPRRYGPFPITHVISRTSYQLQLPSQWKIHNVFPFRLSIDKFWDGFLVLFPI
jgi:hypothetical protein